MALVTFYLVDEKCSEVQATIFQKACQSILEQTLQSFRIAVHCEDQTQAELLDELLWQLPPQDFVPHQLIVESGSQSCQTLIGWVNNPPKGYRQILVNLAQTVPNFAPSFAQVIDFVPCDETLKQRARDRYQIYRQAGHQIQTAALDTSSNA